MRSVVVVLPASTCAMMPMLRRLSSMASPRPGARPGRAPVLETIDVRPGTVPGAGREQWDPEHGAGLQRSGVGTEGVRVRSVRRKARGGSDGESVRQKSLKDGRDGREHRANLTVRSRPD